MLKNFYTIYYKTGKNRYGHESSQISRQVILKKLGYNHFILLGLPFVFPEWQKILNEIGYRNYIVICNSYSDIANDDVSVTLESYLNQIDYSIIKITDRIVEIFHEEQGIHQNIFLNEEGFITHIDSKDYRCFYTSNCYLKKDKRNNSLIWYNKDETIALIAYPNKERDYVFFTADNKLIGTSDTLVKLWLTSHIKKGDVVLSDMVFSISPEILRLLRFRGAQFYQIVHYNILSPLFSPVIPYLKKNINYLAASEKLVEPLRKAGLKVDFIPPIHVEKPIVRQKFTSITSYCLVGSISSLKRVEMAITAFSILYKKNIDVHLTIYTGDKDSISKMIQNTQLSDNISFVANLYEVPYHKHQAYLSCSQSECFANSLVEASSKGLTCLISDVDIAHRFYASHSDGIMLFKTVEELIQSVMLLKQFGALPSISIAERYTLENGEQYYKEAFDL